MHLDHVTRAHALWSISRLGLIPEYSGDHNFRGDFEEHSYGKIFLSSEGGVGFWFGIFAQDDSMLTNAIELLSFPIVLRIEIDEDEVGEDEIGTKDSEHPAYYTEDETIAPEDLQYWNGAEWVEVVGYDAPYLQDLMMAHAEIGIEIEKVGGFTIFRKDGTISEDVPEWTRENKTIKPDFNVLKPTGSDY